MTDNVFYIRRSTLYCFFKSMSCSSNEAVKQNNVETSNSVSVKIIILDIFPGQEVRVVRRWIVALESGLG